MNLYNIKYLKECPSFNALHHEFVVLLKDLYINENKKTYDSLFLGSLEILFLHNLDVPNLYFEALVSKNNSKEVININKKIKIVEKEFIYATTKSLFFSYPEIVNSLSTELSNLTPESDKEEIKKLQIISPFIPETTFFKKFLLEVTTEAPEALENKNLRLITHIALEYFLLNQNLQNFRNKPISQLKNILTSDLIHSEIHKKRKSLDKDIANKYLVSVVQLVLARNPKSLLNEMINELNDFSCQKENTTKKILKFK